MPYIVTRLGFKIMNGDAGIEPGASHMRSVRTTTELHPRLALDFMCIYFLFFWKGESLTLEKGSEQDFAPRGGSLGNSACPT